jgi:hypothetical protein
MSADSERLRPRPAQTVTGVVEADTVAVWAALLETSRPLTSIAGVHTEADPVGMSLVVSGQWWYRGEYTVSDGERGSVLTYSRYNVAPRFSRWLVPLVAGSALRSSGLPMFRRQLAEIGRRLGARAYLAR